MPQIMVAGFLYSKKKKKLFFQYLDITKVCYLRNEEPLTNVNSSDKAKAPRENLFIVTDDNRSVAAASPFTVHYKRIRSELIKRSIQCANSKIDNKYYNPDLMKIIHSRLHVMPMWSFVLVNELNINGFNTTVINRLTNNPVECYFNTVKHQVCYDYLIILLKLDFYII